MVAQQQIGQARTQMTAKQREMRMVRLTLDEVSTLPPNLNVYEGVGKMYVNSLLTHVLVFVIVCAAAEFRV